ncbi:unnamed protein product [Rotaria sordida]|uniref:Uncharacterized protein n=1 Tax=Rotaria sordida TaxID=392033 RepID=A0A818UPA0_9BILA|nr:unnamed protein product [Rotaria sordida]CAF3698150.1 unnamed protein product [Rotaria sordida]
MIPMLPMCAPRVRLMPCNPRMACVAPAMVPMMPMTGSPAVCPMNKSNMFSITSLMSELDSHLYGRFRHVERENPCYRHAPFDWYRPPKQCCHVIHEDAAVVTHDGPVPIGDFYRYYIYGDNIDDYGDSSSLESDDYDDLVEPPYNARTRGYQGGFQREPDFYNGNAIASQRYNRSPMGIGNYTTLNTNRRTMNPASATRSSNFRGTRTLAGDDDFDDAASVNSTYGN